MTDANSIHIEKGIPHLRAVFDSNVHQLPTKKPPARHERTNTNAIMATHFSPLKWVIPGYVCEGLFALAGRQKLGKTWLAIDWAIAVATGGIAMGSISCEQGDVLYVDLENGPRRVQQRINTLFPDPGSIPDLSRLEWLMKSPQLNEGFFDELDSWRLSVADPRFVVIDVLQRIKPPGNLARNAYENDYSTWTPLQQWALEHRVAVLGLHHTRKAKADDPLEALSGSNGLPSCADAVLVLDSDQNGKTLYVRGRDVEEKETAVNFAGGFWTVLGDASEVRRSDERSAIIETIRDHGEPMTPTEIAAALETTANNVKQLLYKMAKNGDVCRMGKGRYGLEPLDPHNSDNRSNPHDGDDDE
jgi:AAA domain